jgi:ketosteroid isomerase-like protein
MSEENVKTLRRIAAAWNRRDLDVWLGFMHPEIEWVPARKRLEGGAYRGHSGMREYMADIDVDYSGLLMVEIDEVRDLGDVAVGLGHVQGESAGGIPVNTQYGVVIGFRDGLAVSGSTWFSHAEALEAAGLSG